MTSTSKDLSDKYIWQPSVLSIEIVGTFPSTCSERNQLNKIGTTYQFAAALTLPAFVHSDSLQIQPMTPRNLIRRNTFCKSRK